MIWYEPPFDDEAQRLQDYADYYSDICMTKLRSIIPGISKSVAKCICYAAIDKEEYAIDIANKARLDDRDMFCLLEWQERIEQCAYEDDKENEEEPIRIRD